MAYIGKQPLVGNYQVLDALTATTTDTYALTKNSVAVFPQTPANCIVSLNGVIQAPFDSYTISGSNIVFASALTASDSIDFITVLGDVLNVGTVSDGTIGISKLSATGTPSSSTFLRGDNSWVSAGGTNTPAFEAIMSGNQGISNGSNTKINFNTKNFDTDSCYDNTTNYRFLPTVSGKYFIYTQLGIFGGGNTTLQYAYTRIYKNGSDYKSAHFDLRANEQAFSTPHTTAIVTLNGSTDYVEVYALAGSTGSPTIYLDYSVFGAYKIIE